MSTKAKKEAKAQVAKFPKLSAGAHELFMALWNDAGNWSGNPLFGGNVGGSQESKGYLTKLKRAKLLTTQVDDENKNCSWVTFTELGKALAAELLLNEQPAPATKEKAPQPRIEREERNGVRKPIKGLCADVWAKCAELHDAGTLDSKTLLAWSDKKGLNRSNTSQELSAFRRFSGLSKPRKAAS